MFNRNRADRDDRVRFGAYWRGRGSRVEYAFALALMIAAHLLLHDRHAFTLDGVLILFSARRLHDFGQSGWWALLPLGIIISVVVLGAAAHVPGGLGLASSLGRVIGVAFVGFLALMPGDAGPNRFGEPMKLGRARRPPGPAALS